MKLCLVFAVAIAILWMKRPLFRAISGGLMAALILYRAHVSDALFIMGRAPVSRDVAMMVLSFYFIIFPQRVLERRNYLKQAEQPLNWLFNNRRVNTSATPAVIDLFPSTRTMTICAEIVRFSCQGYLSSEDMICVTSFYRHMPESFLPIYPSILIAPAVFGVGVGKLALAMPSLVAALFIVGYTFCPRRMPRSTGQKPEGGRKETVAMLFKGLWSTLLVMMLLIAFDMPVYVATPMTTILSIFMDHLKPWEIIPTFRTAFEPVIIFNTILTMIFKDIITYAGVIHELPVFFGGLFIPLFMVFALIFLFDTTISGSDAIIPLCVPMAITTMLEADVPLLALFIGSAYAAMQVSSTHVRLFIAAECFKVDIGALVRRNIPMILVLFAITLAYTTLSGVF